MKDFIPYEEALELKQLGFDEPCLAWYSDKEIRISGVEGCVISFIPTNTTLGEDDDLITAPLFSQAFRFFREKYNLYGFPKTTFGSMNPKQIVFFYYWIKDGEEFTNIKEYSTYEEAELACLRKLIEIVKQK